MKIRYLLIEARQKKNLTLAAAAKLCGLSNHSALQHLETCLYSGDIATWKKIQKGLSIKDKDMWKIITTYKYVEKPEKKSKI